MLWSQESHFNGASRSLAAFNNLQRAAAEVEGYIFATIKEQGGTNNMLSFGLYVFIPPDSPSHRNLCEVVDFSLAHTAGCRRQFIVFPAQKAPKTYLPSDRSRTGAR